VDQASELTFADPGPRYRRMTGVLALTYAALQVVSRLLSAPLPDAVALAVDAAVVIVWLVVIQRLWRMTGGGTGASLLAAAFVTTAFGALVGILPLALRAFGDVPPAFYVVGMWVPLIAMILGPILLGLGLLVGRLTPTWVAVLAMCWGLLKTLPLAALALPPYLSALPALTFAVVLGITLMVRLDDKRPDAQQCV